MVVCLAFKAIVGIVFPVLDGLCAGFLGGKSRPHVFILGRNTPSMLEAAGVAGRLWNTCYSPLC